MRNTKVGSAKHQPCAGVQPRRHSVHSQDEGAGSETGLHFMPGIAAQRCLESAEEAEDFGSFPSASPTPGTTHRVEVHLSLLVEHAEPLRQQVHPAKGCICVCWE